MGGTEPELFALLLLEKYLPPFLNPDPFSQPLRIKPELTRFLHPCFLFGVEAEYVGQHISYSAF